MEIGSLQMRSWCSAPAQTLVSPIRTKTTVEVDSMCAQTTAFVCKRLDVCFQKIAPELHQGVCTVATERIDWKNPDFCVSVFYTTKIIHTA